MGYQQSFVKFESEEVLKEELKKYISREKEEHPHAVLYGVSRVIQGVRGKDINKGELLAIVGGERYAQRSTEDLLEYMGIDNAQRVIFIDNVDFYERSNGDLGKFLDSHFQQLSESEFDELLKEE